MTNILEIRNLKKSYQGRTVLNIESLNIEEGKITVLVGPSGAGKSTLLSILNGMEKPDEGRVIFQGEEFSKEKAYSNNTYKKMAMVFQKPIMFNTSVYKNIAYGLKIRKVTKGEIQERVQEIAQITGLTDRLTQKAITLSGGEAGRVSLARAMILKPNLLLMDEPTANLDPENVAKIEEMIIQAKNKFGTSIVLVTHNVFQAKRLADNIITIMNGSISDELFIEQMEDWHNGKSETVKYWID